MRRRLGILLAGCIAVGAVTAAFAAIPHGVPPAKTLMSERLAHWIPPMIDAVVLISTKDGIGTGFHVGNGFILTAAHVVAGNSMVSIKDTLGGVADAAVVRIDLSSDLAVLSTKHKMLAAELDCRTAKVGEAITAIGNPLGLEFITSEGHIAGAPRKAVSGTTVYITDIVTIMGQSGAPVFASSKVIGVTQAVMVASLPHGQDRIPSIVGFGFVVPSTSACLLLAMDAGA